MEPSIVVLLVEDEAMIRTMLQETLEDGGFSVVIAEDGREALSVLEEQDKGFRGLVTDIDLGQGPNGWEVAQRARELNGAIAVVYMSGASAYEWASHGLPNSTMVSKPFAPAQIITAISAQLNAGAA